MIQRIFIAISLPEEIRKALIEIQNQYNLPVRWVDQESLHVTLLFLGAVRSDQVSRIIRITEKIVSGYPPFVLDFKRVAYGPDDSMPPQMVWLKGSDNNTFNKLRNEIDQKLKEEQLYYLSGQSDEIKIHITMGRIRKWEWSKVNPEDREEINQIVDFMVPVNEILVMESKLMPGRPPKYSILEKIPLKQLG